LRFEIHRSLLARRSARTAPAMVAAALPRRKLGLRITDSLRLQS
jgi:hypothetical protein